MRLDFIIIWNRESRKIIASMAELDDFFAKKDKKKSKTKSKFVTADELVRNLEECTKREVAATAVKPKKPEVSTTLTGGVAEGGENESNIKVPEPNIEVRVAIKFQSSSQFHIIIQIQFSPIVIVAVHSPWRRNGKSLSRSSARITVA